MTNLHFPTLGRSLVAATLCFGLGATMASAETWRMATKQPSDSPEGIVYDFFAERVAELSGGDLTVDVYPNEQLGREDSILEQLELGTQDAAPGQVRSAPISFPAAAWCTAPCRVIFPRRLTPKPVRSPCARHLVNG